MIAEPGRKQSIFILSNLEILEFDITPDDKFLIVASDGVWEYLSNEDVSRF